MRGCGFTNGWSAIGSNRCQIRISRGLRAFGSAVWDPRGAGWARNILGNLQRFVSGSETAFREAKAVSHRLSAHYILPVAQRLDINKQIGWHTFAIPTPLHRSTGAELKIMQELLRYSTIGVTRDTRRRRSQQRSVVRRRPLSRSCSRKRQRNDQGWPWLELQAVPILSPRENGGLPVSL